MLDLYNRNIRVAVSHKCNLNCIYCDWSVNSRTFDKPWAMEDFRSTLLDYWVISTSEFIEIIKSLHTVGFGWVTLTWGEPLLNKDWDKIVNKSREIGMSRVCVTTNWTLLSSYINSHKQLPEWLTLLTISLDTVNSDKFKSVTSGGDFNKVINWLNEAKKNNPDIVIKANKVLLRSDIKSLLDYIQYCEKSWVIDEINLLNLILKEDKNKDFFEKEFISAQEVMQYISTYLWFNFSMDNKYEFITTLPSWMKIIIKDTNLTMRNDICDDCSIYCQEWFYTVRVATDWTIMTCADYNLKLNSIINWSLALKTWTLITKIEKLVQIFTNTTKEETLNKFFKKKWIWINY